MKSPMNKWNKIIPIIKWNIRIPINKWNITSPIIKWIEEWIVKKKRKYPFLRPLPSSRSKRYHSGVKMIE